MSSKKYIVTVKEISLVTYLVEADSPLSIDSALLEYINSDAIEVYRETLEPLAAVSVEVHKP